MTRSAPRPFMTADWNAVVGITYAADEHGLAPYLPPGAEIDHLDGAARVSLVAFVFRRTRMRGIAIPGHVRFPEINLRFYVRYRGERAVVFVGEFVPRPAIALTAKLLYNEPYRTIRMREQIIAAQPSRDGRLGVRHRFGPRLANRIEAWADPAAAPPAPESAEYWLTHHELGLGRTRDGRTSTYRVEHPVWALHAVQELSVEVDFASLYGEAWGYLSAAQPSHVTLARGSNVRVSPAAI